MKKLLTILAAAAACGALAAPMGASASISTPAEPATGGFAMVHATPLFDKHLNGWATPDIGGLIFVLKNDYTFCLAGTGAGNPVKTAYETGCSSFNSHYGNYSVVFISQNGYALRAKNDGTVILSTESNPDGDQNASWDPHGQSGSTIVTFTNTKLGGVSNLVAANDAVNSSVYARNVAGDWRFISQPT